MFKEELHGNKDYVVRKQLFGLFLYIIIVLIFIPEFIWYTDHKWLLPLYLPNVDMIATVLTWWGGPGGIWKYLYVSDANFYLEFISQTMINYGALIGMLYIVSEMTTKHGLYHGWSYGIIMSLCSYLLPSYIIDNVMN